MQSCSKAAGWGTLLKCVSFPLAYGGAVQNPARAGMGGVLCWMQLQQWSLDVKLPRKPQLWDLHCSSCP